MHKLFVAGLSWKTAPVALRERLAVAPADRAAAGRCLLEAAGLREVVLLWTCNRVEIYGVAAGAEPDAAAMLSGLAGGPLRLGEELYLHRGADAMRHLFTVAGGLDSMVLGETEITGQVKTAYEAAHQAGLTGKVLNKLFQRALTVAKQVRTRTNIGKGATSVGSVTVQHAQNMFGAALPEKKVLVVGAGPMAEACLKHLAKRGVTRILVANRSSERAQELARVFGGEAVAFEGFCRHMEEVDIVISSTGCPHTIIHRQHVEEVMARRGGRPLVVLDIAVPRDVDPALKEVPGVHLFDIDDLKDTVRENVAHRERDLAQCREIIDAHADELGAVIGPALAAPAPEPALAGAG